MNLKNIYGDKIMQQNQFQRLDMQISRENTYTGLEIIQKENVSIEESLKKHYRFPSNNFDEIHEFVSKDPEMEKIIQNLPEIISKELQYNKISLDFMKETDPIEKILEIVVYSDLESNKLLQTENLICDMLIDKYPNTTIEYILLVDSYGK